IVKVDRASHLVAIAGATGQVQLAHVPNANRLQVGQRVSVATRALRNGTFAASALRVLGRAPLVHVRGVVLARGASILALSAHGAVLKLQLRPTRALSARGPHVGSVVNATVRPSVSGLVATSVSLVSATAGTIAIEGVVTALGNG